MFQGLKNNIILKSNEFVLIDGIYSYAGSPNPNEIPCWPNSNERTVFLKKGDLVPRIKSCKDHEAVYELIGQT